MSIEKTFKELSDIDVIVGGMYAKNPDMEKTKFAYAYKKFANKNYYPVLKDYREALADARIEHALTSKESGVLLVDGNSVRGYQYDKPGLKAVVAAERALEKEYNAKVIKVEPYLSKEVPPDLSEEAKDLFNGLFISLIEKPAEPSKKDEGGV